MELAACFLDADSDDLVRQVEAALERVGLTLVPFEAETTFRSAVFFRGAIGHAGEVLARTSEHGRERVAAISLGPAPLTASDAIELLGQGASEVIEWDDADAAAQQLAARFERWRSIDELVGSAVVRDRLVGDSLVWLEVLRDVVEVARFTPASILITGESGTGKELVAQLVHELDDRPAKRDFVLVDCTTVVPTLSGSEFFGHERGAFTGAVSDRDGAFALAHKGTLFLDEVGELALTLQAELLRVVQEGAYKRLGSNAWHRTSFRLVCATNRDLAAEVTAGRFRHDFYHRIAGWTCCLPSLAERRADIPDLARQFLVADHGGAGPTEFEPSVLEYLQERPYPGNVRELRHLVLRLRHRHVGRGPITLADVPRDERRTLGRGPAPALDLNATLAAAVRAQLETGRSLRELLSFVGDTAVDAALAVEDGSVGRAATRLGVTPRALQLRRKAQAAKVVPTAEPAP